MIMKHLLFSILSEIAFVPFISGCQSGWKQHRNKCYLFSDAKSTFSNAASYCSSNGGKLAEPQTSDENSFIELQLSFETKDTDYFIGITDIFEQDSWVYSSSLKPVMPFVAGWRPGEPNNYGGREDCVFIRAGLSGWLDGNCFTKNSFVCENAQSRL